MKGNDSMSELKDLLDSTGQEKIDQVDMFLSILNSMGDGVVVADKKGNLIFFNPAAVRILGSGPSDASPEEWREKYGFFLIDKTTPVPLEEFPLLQAIQGRWSDCVEMFVHNEHRREGVFISATARPLLDNAGAIRGGVLVFQDITERFQRNELIRSFLESAPDAMVVCDLSGRILFANNQTELLFGYTAMELIGKAVEILVPDAAREAHRKHRDAYSQNPRIRPMGGGKRLQGVAKNGFEFPVEVSLSPIDSPEGILIASAIRAI